MREPITNAEKDDCSTCPSFRRYGGCGVTCPLTQRQRVDLRIEIANGTFIVPRETED